MYIYDIQSDRIHKNHPKHSNLKNCCFRYIRPQKSPKISQKNDNSITICSIFWIGMAYFIWYVVNPHDGSEYICQRGVGGHLGQFTPVIFRNNTRFWPMTSFWAAMISKRRLGHIWPPGPSKVRQLKFLHRKIAVFEMFFCTKSNFLAKWSIVAHSYHTYSESYCSSG